MSISANLGGKKSLLFFIAISSWHPYGHWNFCKLILLWAVSQTCKGQEREKSRKKTKTFCSRKIISGFLNCFIYTVTINTTCFWYKIVFQQCLVQGHRSRFLWLSCSPIDVRSAPCKHSVCNCSFGLYGRESDMAIYAQLTAT